MKVSITIELPTTSRDALFTALQDMLRTLPPTVKMEIQETRKTTLYGGDELPLNGEPPRPIELAIAELSKDHP